MHGYARTHARCLVYLCLVFLCLVYVLSIYVYVYVLSIYVFVLSIYVYILSILKESAKSGNAAYIFGNFSQEQPRT